MAEEALAVLGRSPVDVILSGLHLTGMGGFELLAEVKRRAPRVIRIASSSCAHRATIVSALDVAHIGCRYPHVAEPSTPLSRAGCRDGGFYRFGRDRKSNHLPEHGHGVQVAPGREFGILRAPAYDLEPSACDRASGDRFGEVAGSVRAGVLAI